MHLTRKQSILSLGLTLVLVSCVGREEGLTPSQQEVNQTMSMSIEERAIDLFAGICHKGLRGNHSVSLSSIDSTETNTPDTKLYVANFDEGGFLLFRNGGEEQMTLLGFSESSSLQLSDAEDNPALKQVISNGVSMAFSDFNKEIIPSPPIIPGDPNRPPRNPWDEPDIFETVITSRSKYVKYWFEPQTYQYFNQRSPFNGHIKDGHLAGCGPIAIATILSHYEKQAGGSQINWKLLKEKYNSSPRNIDDLQRESPELLFEMQRLVADTWLYAHILSTESFTMSSRANVANYLKRAGFNVAYQHKYDAKEVCTTLKEKHQPFILMGWSKDEQGKKGHYWVVDGVAQQITKEVGYTKNKKDGTKTPGEWHIPGKYYIHCTWGWGGHRNGWFNPQLINKNEGKQDLRSDHPQGEYYDLWTYFIWL